MQNLNINTSVSISSCPERSLEQTENLIHELNEELCALEFHLHDLAEQEKKNPDTANSLYQEQRKVQKRYQEVMDQRMELVKQLPGNIVVQMARSSCLEKGVRLFHCSSIKAVGSILSEGIKLDVEKKWSQLEMGKGLYCSLYRF
jgi:hypothetical protein